MKFALCLLALVTVAMCRTVEIDERFIFGSGFSLKDAEQALLDALGSDTSEAACEAACPGVLSAIPGAALAAPLLCSPACHSLQSLVQG